MSLPQSKLLGALRSGVLSTGKLRTPCSEGTGSKLKALTKSSLCLPPQEIVRSSLTSSHLAGRKRKRGKGSKSEKVSSETKPSRYDALMRTIRPERLLRVKRIKQKTLLTYADHVEDFLKWCSTHERSYKTLRQADVSMATYFNMLFDDGSAQNTASYTLFGWITLRVVPNGPERDLLPLSLAALTAWRSSSPSKSRVGVPPQVIYCFAQYCISQDHVDAAAAVLLQYDLYVRPSEILGVRGVDIVPPVSTLTSFWGVIFGNSDFGEPTKSGAYDDVVLADPTHRTYACTVLKHIYKKCKQSPKCIFPRLTLSVYEGLFRDFSKLHKLAPQVFSPHVIRHSGPSFDVMHSHRDIAAIQSRGRWASAASVARYKKPGRLLLQASQLPPALKYYNSKTLNTALTSILSHPCALHQ